MFTSNIAAAGLNNFSSHSFFAVFIHLLHGFNNFKRRACFLGSAHNGECVFGKTGPAISWARVQKLTPNASIKADAA